MISRIQCISTTRRNKHGLWNSRKTTTLDNRWIPSICGTVGGILGILAMRIMPDFPATDYITAVAVGIVSGLAATGVNQIGKQLGKE